MRSNIFSDESFFSFVLPSSFVCHGISTNWEGKHWRKNNFKIDWFGEITSRYAERNSLKDKITRKNRMMYA